MYPDNYLYSEEHEWLLVEEGVCTLGITQFAQNELGEVVFVELPTVGDSVDTGDEIGTLESVKAVAEIYTPLGGEIIEVNSELDDSPELVNEDPHSNGWICKIRMAADTDLGGLMSAEKYADFASGDED